MENFPPTRTFDFLYVLFHLRLREVSCWPFKLKLNLLVLLLTTGLPEGTPAQRTEMPLLSPSFCAWKLKLGGESTLMSTKNVSGSWQTSLEQIWRQTLPHTVSSCIPRMEKKRRALPEPNNKKAATKGVKEAFFGVSPDSKWLDVRRMISMRLWQNIRLCDVVPYLRRHKSKMRGHQTRISTRLVTHAETMNYVCCAPFTCLAGAFLVPRVGSKERDSTLWAQRVENATPRRAIGDLGRNGPIQSGTHISVFVANMGVCII